MSNVLVFSRLIPSGFLLDVPNRKKSTTKNVACGRDGCKQTFASKRDLGRHTTTVHDQVFVKCPHCQKRFKSRDDNLRRHIRRFCKVMLQGKT